jgi:hypothetical protein
MNYNYKLFDVNGLLADGSDTPTSKGNNAVDVFYFHFAGHDYNDTYITVSVTLPDGTALPELGTSNSDFTFKDNEYKGFKVVFLEPVTAQAGEISMTIQLWSKSDDRKLCSSRITKKIYDSDVATDNTITDVQYHQMLQAIDDNYKNLDDNKLYRDFTKYKNEVVAENTDVIAINRDGETRNIQLDKIHNINTVNNIYPVNKNIDLDATRIPYEEINVYEGLKNIENNLEEKATKVELNTKVGHRAGTFESTEDYQVKTGILAITTDTIIDVSNFARILLADTQYIDGDILSCNIELEFVRTDGNSFGNVSFTRVLNVGTFSENVFVEDSYGNIISLGLYGIVNGNILALRTGHSDYLEIKPKFKFAIVRRY